MSRVVRKFEIGLGIHNVPLPIEREIVSVGLDPNGRLCIWVALDPEARHVGEYISTVFTGAPLPPVAHYAYGSVRAGPHMYHVFGERRQNGNPRA